MNSKILKSSLNKLSSGSVISSRDQDPDFGGMGFKINPKKLREVVDFLRTESSSLIDWCENIVAFDKDNKKYLVYIFESRTLQNRIVMDMEIDSKRAELPSLKGFWPIVESIESQIEQVHDIVFVEDRSWRKDGTWV